MPEKQGGIARARDPDPTDSYDDSPPPKPEIFFNERFMAARP